MASSSSQSGLNIGRGVEAGKDMNFYLPLYKAAIRGDWEGARRFFDRDRDAVTAKITKDSETVLHVAVARSKAIYFVSKLLEVMPSDALRTTNRFHETALHFAAKFGNVEAAKLLVSQDPGLPSIWNDSNCLPLHSAALFGHKEMVIYLLTVTGEHVRPNPFADKPGITLMMLLVHSGFYDVALDLLLHHPQLASTVSPGGNTSLSIIAQKPSSFPSGSCLNFWQKLIYSLPLVKSLREEKLMHCQAMELVRALCTEVINTNNLKSALIYKPAIILGATLGIYEIVEEILKTFPSAIWSLDREHHDLFQIAVMNRRENIFNLLRELDEHTHLVTQNIDTNGNTILHLAGKLAPPHRLNLVTGAALQMQHELQWYKEVEKFVTPGYKVKENSSGKTPAMVFTEEHKDLIAEGEQWFKDTANSCTLVAVLIATVVFAAAITVPGGSNGDNGYPIFNSETPFTIFAISNTLSLFSSTTSVLMFLLILNTRFAEADFLHSLPNKLIIGLVNLFLSIMFMMVAFSSAIYIVFGHKKSWIILPLAFACLPVGLFASLQLPLLIEMIKSTYGPGIFYKQQRSYFWTVTK
ncbi:PREDICTED: ankyrin repeat-containing protein ITN1-like [Ipomoea nil]|uniref:ankyrin repeat-containing protein ITN1-like n=1 Tax=Ipomoea nil TaxID=35883 RepID=UPI000900E1B6|nr:PREDICTED: ankyrin repeat-containing protein ITN1-like [Ipomoea nil]XP_019196822.1 PREDICTED: ankyrin repeat-containing protein ITN1-like [Ipomoea nil]